MASDREKQKPAPHLRLFTFPALWGLPTCGPFGLKLEICLQMLGVSYERVYEGDASKGPKRKSPWIEDGAVRLGDTEMILAYLTRTYGLALPPMQDPVARARAHFLRRALEEHFHQVMEYELMLLEEGFSQLCEGMLQDLPFLLRPIVPRLIQRTFRKHLFERGIARHTQDEITALGRDDVDAIVAILGDSPWFSGEEEPSKIDATVFGLLAPVVRSPIPTPVFSYVRAQPSLVRFVDRTLARFFPEFAQRAEADVPARAHASEDAAP